MYGSIAGRLLLFQIDPDERFAGVLADQVGMIEILLPRGDILDRNGRVLATNRMTTSIEANPGKVQHPGELARYLAPKLEVDERLLYKRLTSKRADGRPMESVYLRRRMSDAQLRQLGDINDVPDAQALTLKSEPRRFYPEQELAAPILGFTNLQGTSEGIEFEFDEFLRSEPGLRVSSVDGRRQMLANRTHEFRLPSGGDSVRLTIDTAIQHTLERELDNAIGKNNAVRAMGVVMDCDTGEILALATRLAATPGFNPNQFSKSEAATRRNRAVIDTFEPGSAFKIVTAAAALEHGLITPEDEIDCMGGMFNPYGRRIPDTHPMGVVPFAEAFAVSSNIAMVKVAALLGAERLDSWIRRFEFDQKSGLGLPGESSGIYRDLDDWSGWSMGALPMGQEISVNLMQLAKAFSVIANGGHMVRPYVVKDIRSDQGEVRFEHQTPENERVISENTARIMQELCYGVVSHEEGTGDQAAIPEYRVGGKTGTAQIFDRSIMSYSKDRYTTVFAGFAPLADPKITCVIVVQEPMVELHYGGHVCGPVFKKVVRDALIRLHVPEDPMPPGDIRPISGGTPDRTRLAYENVLLELHEPSVFDEDLDGLELLPPEGDENAGGPELPDFTGLSKFEAKSVLASLGLKWDPQGAGWVVRQEPPAGTRLENVKLCKLIFANAPKDDDEV